MITAKLPPIDSKRFFPCHGPASFSRWAAFVALCLLLTRVAPAQTATLSAGTNPCAVAVNSVTNKIYVADAGSNSVTVIDGSSESTTTVAVGASPSALAVNTVTNKIYVANRLSSSVTIIDGATNEVANVAVGALPQSVAVNQATNKIYVADYGDKTVTVIDGETNTTITVLAGTNPQSVAVNPATNKIYVANYGSASVTVIDGATNDTSIVSAGQGPSSVAVNSVTDKIYVANSLGANVTVIDGATTTTTTINAGTTPDAVAVDTVGDKVYVTNKGSNNLTVIDGATNGTSTVAVGTTPVSVAVNSATGLTYVANSNAGNVTVINGSTEAASTVTTGTSPASVAVNSVTGQIYVANYSANSISVLGTAATASATAAPATAKVSKAVTTTTGAQPSFTLSTTAAGANAAPTTYIAYGDSITYGSGASSTATRYASRLATDLSVALTDRGVGGAEACDTAQVIMSNDNPPASHAPVQTIEIGTNDGFKKGTGAYEAVYQSCHQASLAWLAIPASQKTDAQSCTQTGTWEPDTTYVAGVAAKSSTPGATLSCGVTSYGGPIYLWYRVTDGNAGTFQYSLDGGALSQPVNSFSNPAIATWNGGVDGVFLIRMAGVAAGSHTVQVMVNSAVVSILAVGSLNPAMQPGAPEVFVGGVIRYQYDASPAVSLAYNNDAQADVALLSGDGLPVYFVPVRNFVNANSDMFDGFHPNDTGHLHLRDAYESLSQFPLNSPASFSSSVTVTPVNGFNSLVTLAASAWPTGITGTFGTNPTATSSAVNISVAPTVAPGSYSLAVTGTSGSLSAATTIPLSVAAAPSFTLSATAAAATAAAPGTSTVTVVPLNGFQSIVEFTLSGWPTGITATFAPNPTNSTSTATINVTASVAPGLYNLTLVGSLGTLSASTTIALKVTAVAGLASSATFTQTDTTTQGNWSGTYGGDGYLIAGGTNNLPAYATVALTGASTYVWTDATTDLRALETAAGSTNRIAACYYVPSNTALYSASASTFSFGVFFSDGGTHQVAMYLLDWDTTVRAQTIVITDTASGIVLDSRSFSQFNGGTYAVWNVHGNVTINVTATALGGAVTSGLFFGPTTPAPVISAVSVSSISTTAATISWTTNQASTTQVNYGTTSAYGSSSSLNSNLVQSHTVTLTGLTPGTTYNYDVVSTNSAGTTSGLSTNYTFSTILPPPVISGVSVSNVTTTSATVTWTTDQASSSQVNYGTTNTYGSSSPLSSSLVQSHTVTLTGLTSGTTYSYDVVSTNSTGTAGLSGNYTFSTAVVVPAPVISAVSVTSITTTGATITWTTDQASTTQVNYGTTNAYGSTSPASTSLVQSHSVTLSGLTPGTTYNFDVVSANLNNLSSTSSNSTFQTNAAAAGPVITSVAAGSITATTATITWTTDQASTSVVNYGGQTASSATLVTSHSVVLSGLTASTQYSFTVTSVNAANVASTSSAVTFSTASPVAIPPQVGYVGFWGVPNTGIAVSWSTDVAASTQLNYGVTPSLGTLTPVQATLTSSHGVVLSNLIPGTTYYFVAQSQGANGATGYSTTYSYTTSGTAPAPIISNIQASASGNSATITWTTDQATTSQVNYGLTTSYSASSTVNATLTTNHSVTVTNLLPSTTYNFDVISANVNNLASTSANVTFPTGPTIIGVTAGSVTTNAAIITWTTDEPSTSVVTYGTQSASSAGLVTSHSVALTGLTPGTLYNFTVTSANAAGSLWTSSSNNFTTVAVPVISYMSYWGITSSGITISWATNVPSTTVVNYGTTSALGSVSPAQTGFADNHGVVLTGLQPNTLYYFQAQSTDANGNTGYSPSIYTFTTLASLPVISSPVVTKNTNNTASISWTTSVPTFSYVQYGTSSGNYIRFTARTSLTTSPNCILAFVPSGTVYYQLVSVDASGNQVVSKEATFVEP
jgi:YVTN family beta-propeller protein